MSDLGRENGHQANEINALGATREVVDAALPILGVDPPRDRFPCPLPRHQGAASVYRHGAPHSFKIACWCAGGQRPQFLSLGEVFAVRAGRHARDLSELETAVWFRRLFFEAGALTPALVTVPPLPHASKKHDDVRDGFVLLLGLRWLTHAGQPVSYSKSFAAVWTGAAASTTQLALNAMKQHGVMVEAGRSRSRTKLYLPGEVGS